MCLYLGVDVISPQKSSSSLNTNDLAISKKLANSEQLELALSFLKLHHTCWWLVIFWLDEVERHYDIWMLKMILFLGHK